MQHFYRLKDYKLITTLFFLMSAITAVLTDVKGHLFSNADVIITSLVTLTIY